MKQFPLTRIYSDENGDSHFEDMFVPMSNAGDIGALSESQSVKGIIFREVEPTYDYNFHNAPQKQYIILLDGEIEIETSQGEIKRFGAGEILLVEDTTGKGHRTRNLKPEKRKSVFVTL
jgi:quercetin dioxygenase-like cupin family protein